MSRWGYLLALCTLLLAVYVGLALREISRLELDTARLTFGGQSDAEDSSVNPAEVEYSKRLADFDEWLGRPLFWPGRRPLDSSEPETAPKVEAKLGNIRLVGIVGTEDDRVALLEREGKVARIRDGSEVTPGWTLEKIGSDSVVIQSNDGQSTTLRLFETIGGPPPRALPRRQLQEVDADQGRRGFPVVKPVDEAPDDEKPAGIEPAGKESGDQKPVGRSSRFVSKEEMAKRLEALKRASARMRGTNSSASEELDNEDREKDANGNSASAVPSPQTQESGRED